MRDFGPFLTKRIQEFRNLGTYLASRWALLTNWLRGSVAAEHVPEKQADLAATDLGDDTIKYLGDLANESFKRQLELDETVWRSLPFFAATFAFVATIIGKSAEDVPQWGLSFAGDTALIMLVAAVFSLAWALRWFWVVLRPREYEYPAPDQQVKEYAVGIRDFYTASGVTDAKALDTKTLAELRLFMIDQYGSAAATNLRHNATKLKARPKVLLFMLLGFALAFLCEALIFMNTHVGVQPVEQGVAPDGAGATLNANNTLIGRQSATKATGTPEVATGEGRRELLGREFQARNPVQAVSRSKTPPPPPSGSGSSPQRPTPPMPQVIAKDSAFNRGGPRPTPTPPKPPRKD